MALGFRWERDVGNRVIKRMPRYFFHLEDGDRIPDNRGHILPDDEAACREAQKMVAALRRCRAKSWRVIVANEWGHDIAEIASARRRIDAPAP
jgi:hypothetical protein